MSLRFQNLILISLMVSLSAATQAAEPTERAAEEISVQEMTQHFKDSQKLLSDACKMKSIERALLALGKADGALKKAKEVLRSRQAGDSAEGRMRSRLMYRIDQDLGFINQLRADLGMAEVDGFESYIQLRRALIRDADQRKNVVRMDHQILLALEARSLKKI